MKDSELTTKFKNNGVTVRLYHKCLAEKYNVLFHIPNTDWYLAPGLSRGDIFTAAGIKTFDTALPQDYFNDYVSTHGRPPDAVWSYDQNKIFGAPYHFSDALQALSQIIQKKGVKLT